MALTPNHLVYGHQVEALPFGERERPIRGQSAQEQWAYRQRLVSEFQSLFQQQYLSGILELKKWRKVEESIQLGDLCLIHEANLKRRDWPIGIVEEIRTNPADGLIRTVMLRTDRGLIPRSIRSLVLLRHLDDYQGREASERLGTDDGPATEAQDKVERDPTLIPVEEVKSDELILDEEASGARPLTRDDTRVVGEPVVETQPPLPDDRDVEPSFVQKRRGPGRPRKSSLKENLKVPPQEEGRRLRSGRVIPCPT